MFDALKIEKEKVQLAKINAELAAQCSQQQFDCAKDKSKLFISSPTGIASLFVAGSIHGAVADVPKPPSSIILSLLLKLL